MRASRAVIFACYTVAGLLVAAAVVGFLSNAWLAFSSPGKSTEPMVSAVGTIVSVGPAQVTNREEIADAIRAAEIEGVPRAEAFVPEPSLGACTVTYTFVVDGQVRTQVDADPRATSWCSLRSGDLIDVAYPVGRPEAVSDDYDKQWAAAERDAKRLVTGLGIAAGVALAIAVGTQVAARRHAPAS